MTDDVFAFTALRMGVPPSVTIRALVARGFDLGPAVELTRQAATTLSSLLATGETLHEVVPRDRAVVREEVRRLYTSPERRAA